MLSSCVQIVLLHTFTLIQFLKIQNFTTPGQVLLQHFGLRLVELEVRNYDREVKWN